MNLLTEPEVAAIDEADVDRYLAERKVRGARNAAQAETPKSAEASREDARVWALQQRFKVRRTRS